MGPLLEAPMGQGFILPDLWLLWWEDPFLDTPTLPPPPCHPPPVPGAVPTCSQAYLLGGHQTCVCICVLWMCVCCVA